MNEAYIATNNIEIAVNAANVTQNKVISKVMLLTLKVTILTSKLMRTKLQVT